MTVTCPSCRTSYRIDPNKVPPEGIRAQCAHCPEIFEVVSRPPSAPMDEALEIPFLEPPTEPAPVGSAGDLPLLQEPTPTPRPPTPQRETAPSSPRPENPHVMASPGAIASPPTPPSPPSPFGSSDPHQRAKRLARALVSDIVVYHPDRRARSLRQGTLRQEFREEIRKSWDEYAGQVGNEFARETTYFKDALNEILAEGTQLF